MIDFSFIDPNVQRIRLKKDQLNIMVLAYLRTFLKTVFFKQEQADESNSKVLLTKPVNLYFERYVFKYYASILGLIKRAAEKSSTLAEDTQMLQEKNYTSFEEYMALVYRTERKTIIYSQIHLVNMVQEVLKGSEEAAKEGPVAYRELIIKQTLFESSEKNLIDDQKDGDDKDTWFKDWEHRYYWRRMINGEYFRDVRKMIEGGNYL
jgi:hypothetical protein